MCCHPRRYLTFVSIFNQVCNLLLELPMIFLSYSWRSWGEILILVIFNLFFKRNRYVYIYIIKKCGRGPKTLTVDPNYIICIFFKVKWEFTNLRMVALDFTKKYTTIDYALWTHQQDTLTKKHVKWYRQKTVLASKKHETWWNSSHNEMTLITTLRMTSYFSARKRSVSSMHSIWISIFPRWRNLQYNHLIWEKKNFLL